jgi:hypothetical protein
MIHDVGWTDCYMTQCWMNTLLYMIVSVCSSNSVCVHPTFFETSLVVESPEERDWTSDP